MNISIESVFLFACALFVLHFIISGCGYTNVEGFFECGSCPWSTAKCPPECPAIPKATKECGVWGLGSGARYKCSCPKNSNWAGGLSVSGAVCLQADSTANLDIGILDLRVQATVPVEPSDKRYELQNPGSTSSPEWVEWTIWVDGREFVQHVTDTAKLDLLNKLAAHPYYIHNIRLIATLDDSYVIQVKTWNNEKGKHLYFSDRTGEIYCLSVTTSGGKDFTHTLNISGPNSFYLQYLGHKESNMPIC